MHFCIYLVHYHQNWIKTWRNDEWTWCCDIIYAQTRSMQDYQLRSWLEESVRCCNPHWEFFSYSSLPWMTNFYSKRSLGQLQKIKRCRDYNINLEIAGTKIFVVTFISFSLGERSQAWSFVTERKTCKCTSTAYALGLASTWECVLGLSWYIRCHL